MPPCVANTVSHPTEGGTDPGDATLTPSPPLALASNPDGADGPTPLATSQPHIPAQTHPTRSPQSSPPPSPPLTHSWPTEKRSHPVVNEEANDTESGSTSSGKQPQLAGADKEANASGLATTIAPTPKREGKGGHGVKFDVLKWEIKDGGSLENKQAGWLGSGQTTRPVTNSTG